MQRIHERMVQHAAHKHEFAQLRRLLQRPRKTCCIKTFGFSKEVLQSIPLSAFVSLAACQWRRGRSPLHYGRSGVRHIVAITKLPQQYGSFQDLLVTYRLPQVMLLAWRGWHSAKGGEGNCGKETLARGLVYRFLTSGGLLDNAVKPPHNHQTDSMQIKPPPLDVDLFRIDFDSHSSNWFRCKYDESILHLV